VITLSRENARIKFADASPRTSVDDPFHASALTAPRHVDVAGTPPGPAPGCASRLQTVPLPATVRMTPVSLDTYRSRANVDSKKKVPDALQLSAEMLPRPAPPPGLFRVTSPSALALPVFASANGIPAIVLTFPLDEMRRTSARDTVRMPPAQSEATRVGERSMGTAAGAPTSLAPPNTVRMRGVPGFHGVADGLGVAVAVDD
jgi:hypothetical protein